MQIFEIDDACCATATSATRLPMDPATNPAVMQAWSDEVARRLRDIGAMRGGSRRWLMAPCAAPWIVPLPEEGVEPYQVFGSVLSSVASALAAVAAVVTTLMGPVVSGSGLVLSMHKPLSR